MPTTLRSRLIGSYLIMILICLSVTGVVLTILLVPQVTRLTYLRLAEKGLPAALRVISLRGQGLSPRDIVSAIRESTAADGTRILLVSNDGRILADSQDSWEGRDVDLRLPQDSPPASRPYVQGRVVTREGIFYYVAVTTSLRPRSQADREPVTWYVVLLAQPRQAIAGLVAEISLGFIATGVMALLVSVGVAFIVARSVAKPLQRITIATEEIARGNYEEQLEITSPEEIGRLATSFNAMAREVEASRQAQSDFVANVSHDLKTPLTSIQGFSQALLDGTADDEDARHRAAEVIHEEADRMARLVNSLLELARIEAGQVVMARDPVALGPLLNDCVEKMALRAQQANVHLDVEHEGDVVVAGDREHLAQVLSNLLDNALKHTPSGGRVSLAARSLPAEPGKRGEEPDLFAEITVSDTGEGISAEDLSRIFERFYRGDKSRTQTGKGAGLGLAIAREIIHAHGGQIRAESIVGLGTKFTIVLPLYTEGG